MKKVTVISIIAMLMFCLCSCGDNDVRYDAIYDTEKKKYIALGDTQEQIESILGEGKLDHEYQDEQYYSYIDGKLNIGYYTANQSAVYISYDGFYETDRFMFANITGETTEQDFGKVYLGDNRQVSSDRITYYFGCNKDNVNEYNGVDFLTSDIFGNIDFYIYKNKLEIKVSMKKE